MWKYETESMPLIELSVSIAIAIQCKRSSKFSISVTLRKPKTYAVSSVLSEEVYVFGYRK